MNGRGDSTLLKRFDLLDRVDNKQKKRQAKFSLRLFFFVFSLIAAFVSVTFSQDIPTLSETLRSGKTEEKRTALMQLRGLRSEDASRAAAAALSDKEPMVRATAASSVTFLPKAEASALLLPLLRDKDEFVRRECAYALGEVGDLSSALALIKAAGDKSLEVRSTAVAALGKVGNPSAVSSLNDILKKAPVEKDELIRRAAARSLGQIAQIMRSGKVRVLTPQNFMPEKYKDVGPKPSPDLQQYFVLAVDTLIHVLDNKNEVADTRREAAFALGAIGDQKAVNVLNRYVSSSDPYLAEISRESLLKLKS
jgi:HEAT repeat protein